MNKFQEIQDEYCRVCSDIYENLLRLGLKVKDVIDKGIVWQVDPTDLVNKDVMAFDMARDDGFWLIEITPDIIAVKTTDDEKVICYRFITNEGVVISGFTLTDLPFLRFGPKMIKRVEEKFMTLLSEYLESIQRQQGMPEITEG